MAATFVPFTTFVDISFWKEVNKKKLNEWMLDETPRPISCKASLHDTIGSNCRLSLSHESFEAHEKAYNGTINLYNTRENFKAADKAMMLRDASQKLWSDIKSHAWLDNPSLLNPFFIASFADLKKFHYVYWTCVPALCYPFNIGQSIFQIEDDTKFLFNYYDTTKELMFICKDMNRCENIDGLKKVENADDVFIVLADPSPVATSFGWPARNLIAAVAALHPTWTKARFISLKGSKVQVFVYTWEKIVELPTDAPKSVGWERNGRDVMAPYVVDLSKQFDPVKLMEQSVNLNISLIKWRLHPDIKLERYADLKVLIFGAGTLGCNIARCLMGWGVKKLSFIDNSTVSYSNPVRQSLSEFNDAVNGRDKAKVAADALKRIYPSIETAAYCITVPMPGHTIDANDEPRLEQEVAKLEQLVKEHDVLFLALDSREARWLPTILANKHRKIAISVALGFDTYVIIRHGIGFSEKLESPKSPTTLDSTEKVAYSQLSCYFCNDVTAPGNSTADRTLDQQCTVSRPGLSMVASGLAVELLSSILQCPEPIEAPAMLGETDDTVSILGAVPHQIRGFVGRFQQLTMCVKRFDRCVACGSAVKEEFEKNGWKFVRDVMNSPAHLENITGLDELQDSVNNVTIDFDDNDSVVSL